MPSLHKTACFEPRRGYYYCSSPTSSRSINSLCGDQNNLLTRNNILKFHRTQVPRLPTILLDLNYPLYCSYEEGLSPMFQ